MIEVVIDTETTGTDFEADRVIEIGCVMIEDGMPSFEEVDGVRRPAVRQFYIDPQETVVSDGAFRVHGLSNAFLSQFPTFAEWVPHLMDFIGDAPLVAHNAGFDRQMLNAELRRLGLAELPEGRFVDTLEMTRRKLPGAQRTLDALCRRFGVDNSRRTAHGALLDAQLLAEVYLHLKGGRQRALDLVDRRREPADDARASRESGRRLGIVVPPSEREIEAHRTFVASLPDGPARSWSGPVRAGGDEPA